MKKLIISFCVVVSLYATSCASSGKVKQAQGVDPEPSIFETFQSEVVSAGVSLVVSNDGFNTFKIYDYSLYPRIEAQTIETLDSQHSRSVRFSDYALCFMLAAGDVSASYSFTQEEVIEGLCENEDGTKGLRLLAPVKSGFPNASEEELKEMGLLGSDAVILFKFDLLEVTDALAKNRDAYAKYKRALNETQINPYEGRDEYLEGLCENSYITLQEFLDMPGDNKIIPIWTEASKELKELKELKE